MNLKKICLTGTLLGLASLLVPFGKKAFAIPVSDLSQGQIEELKGAFRLFDKDASGDITAAELANVVDPAGNMSDAEIDAMINEVDLSGDGVVDFDEFLEMEASKIQDAGDEEAREQFRIYDKDGNGYITTTELKAVMDYVGANMSDADIDSMIADLDGDGDGLVSFEEFAP